MHTASRWFEPLRLALADMKFCARLFLGPRCSTDWILGIPSQSAERLPPGAGVQASSNTNRTCRLRICTSMVLGLAAASLRPWLLIAGLAANLLDFLATLRNVITL